MPTKTKKKKAIEALNNLSTVRHDLIKLDRDCRARTQMISFAFYASKILLISTADLEQKIDDFITQNLSIDSEDFYGRTALYLAITSLNLRAANYLLSKGANYYHVSSCHTLFNIPTPAVIAKELNIAVKDDESNCRLVFCKKNTTS